MSNKMQRQRPKILERRRKTEDGSDVNPKEKVHVVLTSHESKPVAHGCTLPEIGNDRLMNQHTGNINIMHAGNGELVPTQFLAVPAKVVVQQEAKLLSRRSSASSPRLDSQHPQQDARGFKELPVKPAAVKPDCSIKEGSQLKRVRPMAVHLPPIENVTRPSSSSSWSGCKPERKLIDHKTTK